MKAFFDRNYSVVLGLRLHDDKLWHRSTWSRVCDRLRPIADRARGPAAVRSLQTRGTRKVSFGRLSLDDSSNAKWTHDSSETGRDPNKFVNAEVWAPHWNVCVRDGLAPDVFGALAQPFSALVGFDQAILCAVEERLVETCEGELDELARLLEALPGMRLVVRAKRPWGEAMSEGAGYSNAIQDFLYTGLYYPGMKWPIDLNQTKWRGSFSS